MSLTWASDTYQACITYIHVTPAWQNVNTKRIWKICRGLTTVIRRYQGITETNLDKGRLHLYSEFLATELTQAARCSACITQEDNKTYEGHMHISGTNVPGQ